MEWFWAQLVRVDARLAAGAVMIVSAVAACAAILHVGMTPISGSPVSAAPATGAADNGSEPIAESVVARGGAARPPNPFTSEYLAKLLEIQAREQRAPMPPEPAEPTVEPPPPVQEAAPATQEPVPPPPPPMRMVFHGMVLRPDRVRVAFVEDLGAGLTRHLIAGDSLDAYRVETIEFGRLILVNPDQERVVLPIRQETPLEVLPHE